MDNRIFNVNGRTKEQLKLAIDLLLLNEYGKSDLIEGFRFDSNKGLILTLYKDKKNYKSFTDYLGNNIKLNNERLCEVLWTWLNTKREEEIIYEKWEENLAHDGSNSLGWRLYTEDWGRIKNKDNITTDQYSFCAFKPCYLWYGK